MNDLAEYIPTKYLFYWMGEINDETIHIAFDETFQVESSSIIGAIQKAYYKVAKEHPGIHVISVKLTEL